MPNAKDERAEPVVRNALSLVGPPNFPGEQNDYSQPARVTQESFINDADPRAIGREVLFSIFLWDGPLTWFNSSPQFAATRMVKGNARLGFMRPLLVPVAVSRKRD